MILDITEFNTKLYAGPWLNCFNGTITKNVTSTNKFGFKMWIQGEGCGGCYIVYLRAILLVMERNGRPGDP